MLLAKLTFLKETLSFHEVASTDLSWWGTWCNLTSLQVPIITSFYGHMPRSLPIRVKKKSLKITYLELIPQISTLSCFPDPIIFSTKVCNKEPFSLIRKRGEGIFPWGNFILFPLFRFFQSPGYSFSICLLRFTTYGVLDTSVNIKIY